MSVGNEIWLFSVSIIASAVGGMLGMASGIFIVPILTILCHVDLRNAIGAGIVSVIACSCGSAAAFLKERLTNVRLAIVLETATTAGALTGVLLAGRIPKPGLFFMFGTILLLSAWQMVSRRNDPVSFRSQSSDRDPTVRELDSSYPDHELGLDIAYRVERVPVGLILMYVAGLISALLGIGSATALAFGTWLISVVIGVLLSFFPAGAPYGSRVVMAGIGLFILLPITRVILMLTLFVGIREYKFAGVAAFVLAIIVASLVIGALYK